MHQERLGTIGLKQKPLIRAGLQYAGAS